ncbi:MAG: ATP-binding protein [Planctomycetota bacterium]|nr:ATP-binding protein [Planctomycetota bacterium]
MGSWWVWFWVGLGRCLNHLSPVGITLEVLPNVFNRFYRGDASHNDAVDGCGLGLGIAQKIVSANNGLLQIASEPVKFTTVTVRLPLAAAI